MWKYTYTDELYHYGVKGMKWGHRRGIAGTIRDIQTRNAKRDLSNAQSKRRQVNSELRELHGYAKNPSKLGSSKVSTAIRNHQINSLNKTKSKLDKTINDNKNALKELDSIERYQNKKQKQKNEAKARKKEFKQEVKNYKKHGMTFDYKNVNGNITMEGFRDSKGRKIGEDYARKIMTKGNRDKTVRRLAGTSAVIAGAYFADMYLNR